MGMYSGPSEMGLRNRRPEQFGDTQEVFERKGDAEGQDDLEEELGAGAHAQAAARAANAFPIVDRAQQRRRRA